MEAKEVLWLFGKAVPFFSLLGAARVLYLPTPGVSARLLRDLDLPML